ncbi:MAG: formylmethanofuran dehydrogenase subunit A [Mariniblastus sp.]|nr:formylmethanofuran dehydrogenase subunit A [Mariniblastus sp.]
MSYLKLSGGTIYDPVHNVDGVVGDIWIENGKIVEAPLGETDTVTIDVSGRVVMAGAVDMHCHIAGPKVNAARKMQPEQGRIGNGLTAPGDPMGSVPDIMTTGYRYTGLGYTSCFDAAVTPMGARHVHHEFERVPNLDTGFYVLVGNNHLAMEYIAKQDIAGLQSFLAWLINRAGAFAPKLVNPGGVEMWKQRAGGNARDLDQVIDGFQVTPRQVIQGIAEAANRLDLPHPVHIHCNNLGIPGNWSTTLETMRSLDGLSAHLTHIQFHSYGGSGDSDSGLESKVGPLADYINAHPNLTVDVGQVMFGPTTSMTADGPLGYFLQRLSGEKWYSADTELESGCGISPIHYRDKNFVNALQWAIGLEWYLRVENPWQLVMSSDHPNGGSFLAYPQIIRLLMDASFRKETLKRVHPRVMKTSSLLDLDREYTLSEIAIITRAGPARILGLNNKGHLGVGADADVVVYTPSPDFEEMFSWPWMVVKAGKIVVQNGEFQDPVAGKTLSVSRDFDTGRVGQIEDWFSDHYSISVRHYGHGRVGAHRIEVV